MKKKPFRLLILVIFLVHSVNLLAFIEGIPDIHTLEYGLIYSYCDESLINDPSLPAEDKKYTSEEVKKISNLSPDFKFSKECHDFPDYNFGVLIQNEHYTIYRSAAPGDEGYLKLKRHLQDRKLPLPQTVIYMNHYGYKKQGKNFGSVMRLFKPNDQKLREFAFLEERLLEKEQIEFFHPLAPDEQMSNVYLDGKTPLSPSEGPIAIKDLVSKELAEYYQKKGVPLESRNLKGDEESFYNILGIILSRKNRPVLVHCKGGLHRTGMISMAIRHLQGGDWTKEFSPPIEVRAKTGPFSSKIFILRNLAEYEYFLHNPGQFRMDNVLTLREISNQERFMELKSNFGPLLNAPSKNGCQ